MRRNELLSLITTRMDLKNIKAAKNQRIKETHSVVPLYEIQGKVKDIYRFPGLRQASRVQKSMRERPFRWWGWFRSWLWWGDMCQNSWLNRTLKMYSLYHRLYLNRVDLKTQLVLFPLTTLPLFLTLPWITHPTHRLREWYGVSQPLQWRPRRPQSTLPR